MLNSGMKKEMELLKAGIGLGRYEKQIKGIVKCFQKANPSWSNGLKIHSRLMNTKKDK